MQEAATSMSVPDAGVRELFAQDARWQELGNQWGIMLEELITGSRTDIKATLNELEAFAAKL